MLSQYCVIIVTLVFWKHSRLLAPQVVPLNERVIPFHQRYPNLGDMIDELVIKDARNIFHLNSELISTIKDNYSGFEIHLGTGQ